MGTLFLQEVDATIVLADVRDFSPLAQQLGPVDLGLALGRFYEHIGGVFEGHHGRIVKFMGDGVLGAFIGGDHRLHALEAIGEMVKTRRGVSNLVDAATWEGVKTPGRRPEAIETDAVELGADKLRLFKLEG